MAIRISSITLALFFRCFGGTGAFGMSAKSSWYYFQQDLANLLNRELVTYLRVHQKDYPDIHPDCKVFVEPKKRDVKERLQLPKTLINAVGQVGIF